METATGSVTNGIATLESLPVDRLSPVPLYFQLAQGLERAITSGQLAPGARLENEIDLAARLGVSRPTMRRAIEHLVQAHLLERVRGIGTRVLDPAARAPAELPGLWDDLASAGRAPRTEVLEFELTRARASVAEALAIAPGSRVYAFTRLRLAGSEPLAVMRNVVPADAVALTREDLAQYGLYALLRGAGMGPVTCRRTISARGAKGSEARRLGEDKGAAVLTVTQTAYDAAGAAVETGEHVFRASRYSVDVTTTA